MATQPRPSLPLPPRWPTRVRAAAVHALGLARMVLATARAGQKPCDSAALRIARLDEEIHLLKEELRLKDARMGRIPAHRRPHYLPEERLAVLELRAARGWSQAQTSQRMHVTPSTVASWMGRLDEKGQDALVRTPEPVNKYPAFVAYLVRRLKVLCPAMGKARIANVLCRAGLHLSATTVGRMLKDKPRWEAIEMPGSPGRRIHSREADHIWNVDLTTVPTAMGFWCSWIPRALTQRWPFCWWVAVAVDHFSRRVMGTAIFPQQPTSKAVRAFLAGAIRQGRARPRVLITDHGSQFIDKGFGRWCRRRGIRRRFGAVEKQGSLSVVDRLIRTIKNECTRKLVVSYERDSFYRELGLFVEWYNGHRPHSALEVRTPDEVYRGSSPACRTPRIEPRRRWPRGSPCAGPQAPIRGRRSQPLGLSVTYPSATWLASSRKSGIRQLD